MTNDSWNAIEQEACGGSRRLLSRKSFLKRVLSTMGPGLMVCFADTDGSCLITAADSGSKWRYKLLFLQIILVPILYCAQELTVRLALCTEKGLCALLRQEAGPRWAWAVAVPLLADACLALISEINVIGQTLLVCWDVPTFISNTVVIIFLMTLALSGSYAVAEKVGLAMGSLQVLFFITMFMNHPNGSDVWRDMWTFPLSQPSYIKLVTANIGAVIMPWMLSYQQSALVQKGLAGEHDPDSLAIERIDTAFGSVLTQGVMAAVLVTVASSWVVSGSDISNVGQLLDVFTSTTGNRLAAKFLLTFGVCGACLVAAIVVTMCGAWALEEALGHEFHPQVNGHLSLWNRMKQAVRERPAFYVAYSGTCLGAWFLTEAAPDFAINLTGVWTQFINGLLMPPTVFALWYLSAYKLPEEHRLTSIRKWVLFVVFGCCSAFCLASIPFAIKDAVSGN